MHLKCKPCEPGFWNSSRYTARSNGILLPVQVPYGLVVRIRRSHRRGPGSIPGVGTFPFLFFYFFLSFMWSFFPFWQFPCGMLCFVHGSGFLLKETFITGRHSPARLPLLFATHPCRGSEYSQFCVLLVWFFEDYALGATDILPHIEYFATPPPS